MNTLYYYADTDGQSAGPHSLEELVEFRKGGQISNGTRVVEVGSEEWMPFSSLFPAPEPSYISTSRLNPEDVYQCDKCATKIPNSAKSCPNCQFKVADFKLNKKSAKYTEMQKVSYQESDLNSTILHLYKGENGGCMAIGLLLGGAVSMIIPLIGWILGPILIIIGLFILVAPVRGLRFFEEMMLDEEYQKKVRLAKNLLHNRYKNVKCPKCGHVEPEISWPGKGGDWNCLACEQFLLREDDFLFYLPKPEAVPNDNLVESFAVLDR